MNDKEIKPTKHEIEIGRLNKKLNKVLDQRNKARAELDHYKHVISMQPHLVTRYEDYQDRIAERQRVKDLEDRVKEQATLIGKLQLEIQLTKRTNYQQPSYNPSMPYGPITWPKIDTVTMGCSVCGLGSDGKAYGYVCSRNDCPTRVTC